mmetsp:Transcript_40412/g.91617  ORF Transcript_40412/g.91617 Transcript_40412/m.91617 type:complete len:412 (-) Transcript_40412:165-1400(-)
MYLTSQFRAPEARKQVQLALTTLIFGSGRRATLLPLFLKSTSGFSTNVSLYVLTDGTLAGGVPSTVVQVRTNWSDMVGRLELIINLSLPSLRWRTSDFRKIIDFKPCLAFLYPEVCNGASWCGWVDNDMLLSGTLFSQLAQELFISNASAVSVYGVPDKLSFGPLTILRRDAYRDHILPVLLRKGTLRRAFSTNMPRNFDEWGHAREHSPVGSWYSESFSAVLLQIAAQVAGFQVVRLLLPGSAAKPVCRLTLMAGGLSRVTDGMQDVLYCHYRGNRKHKPPLDRPIPERVLTSKTVGVYTGRPAFDTLPVSLPSAFSDTAIAPIDRHCFQELFDVLRNTSQWNKRATHTSLDVRRWAVENGTAPVSGPVAAGLVARCIDPFEWTEWLRLRTSDGSAMARVTHHTHQPLQS